MFQVFQLLSTLVLIAVMTPFTSTTFIPLISMFVFVYIYFQRSALEVKRLDSLSRSPLYAFVNQVRPVVVFNLEIYGGLSSINSNIPEIYRQFSYDRFNALMTQVLVGSATIRTFHAEEFVIKKLSDRVDSNVVTNLANMSLNRWLGFRLEVFATRQHVIEISFDLTISRNFSCWAP